MLLLLLLVAGAVVGYDGSVNYWQAFAPGKLLQRLDALTLDDAALTKQPPSSLVPVAQPKLDDDVEETTDIDGDAEDIEADTDAEVDAIEHDDDADEDDAEVDSTEAHSGEDYERNYEQFVRQYFDRALEQDDNVEEQDAPLEGSIETQAEASNVQRQQKPKEQRSDKCRRVRRHDQLCTICREPRNNEVSETCSYSHEAQPEQYAYGSGSQYKRYRDNKDPVQKRHTTIVQPANSSSGGGSNNSSLCVRRVHGKSICYECKDSAGKRMNRCYDAAISKKSSSSKPRGRQSEQEQRIYKRTISYSYAQGGD
ncbi:hypothetical protein KR093_005632, partial [Drosophila rubida]